MRVVVLATRLFGLASIILSAPAAAKDIGTFQAPDQSFDISVSTMARGDQDRALVLNEMTGLVVRILAKDPSKGVVYTGLGFDARMPAHNHGMIVKPKVTERAPGEYRIDGVKLHMAGAWEMTFAVSSGSGEPIKVVVPLTLK